MKEFLTNCNGCILKKNKVKKGYTLIEVIAAIAISTIVLTMGFTLIISTYKAYVDIINKSIRQDEIDNALLSIDRMVTGNMIIDINFNIVKKEIVINYLIDKDKNLINTKIIKRNNEKLSIETHNLLQPAPTLKATNNILDKVSNFEIIKKGNIYYYKIILKSGDVIIQCI
ncbi:MAG: PulJ/GspJ family protein [Clostridium sp.]